MYKDSWLHTQDPLSINLSYFLNMVACYPIRLNREFEATEEEDCLPNNVFYTFFFCQGRQCSMVIVGSNLIVVDGGP